MTVGKQSICSAKIKRVLRPVWLIFLLTMIAVSAWAVSLEQGQSGPSQRPIPDPPVIRSSCCEPADFLSCVENLRTGKAVTIGGSHFVPIVGSGCVSTQITAMDDALSRGDLMIREFDSPIVSRLIADNRSNHPVLLLAGEIILGGKQNRIVAIDHLAPPRSSGIEIQVFCGERGRWTNSNAAFGKSEALAPAKLRSEIQTGASQTRVWGNIKQRLDEKSVRSSTENLESLYKQGKDSAKLAHCAKQVISRFPRGTNGFVLIRNGRAQSLEILANADLFRRLQHKLLESYLREAPFPHCKVAARPVTEDERLAAEGLLRAARFASGSEVSTTAAGCTWNLYAQGRAGQALTDGCALYHMNLISHAPVHPPVHRPGGYIE